ncbi:MAG: aminoglycoside phosphotransferase family protein [Phycisphaeraceae bacterium]
MYPDLLTLLASRGLASLAATITPLAGGVSSDIYLVEDGDTRFVIKRALAKLRVKDEWLADVSRNRYEQEYIDYVAGFLPEAVPRILHRDIEHGFFTMEHLGKEFANWKALMLGGVYDYAHADLAATILGTIHKHSWNDAKVAARFDTTANFTQLRIDPYLYTTGARHLELKAMFDDEGQRLAATRICLVHGDYSPKNILISPARMVILDCEVAWFGDPAFDVAFLLNHLVLKSLLLGSHPEPVIEMVHHAWASYLKALAPPMRADLEPRVTKLLMMLMLARIDGKSPVEYLSDVQREFVRSFVTKLLPEQPTFLAQVLANWHRALDGFEG